VSDQTEIVSDSESVPLDIAPPSLELRKFTNGVDAATDEAAAVIAAGDAVTWTYEVTNTGTVSIEAGDITITDDQEGAVTNLVDDGDGDMLLAPGETWVYALDGIAEDLNTVIDWEKDLNGAPLAAGTIITNQFQGAGLTVSATAFGAMIFDSANPTGGDNDLATPNLGNILIISEDGDSSDPDDNENGGTITLEWEDPVRFDSTLVLDIEEPGSTITTFNAEGAVIEEVTIPTVGDGELGKVTFGGDLVSKIEYTFAGSGATIPEFVITDIYRNTASVFVDGELLATDNSSYVNPFDDSGNGDDEIDFDVGIFDTVSDDLVTPLENGDSFSSNELPGGNLTISTEIEQTSGLFGSVGSVRLRLTGEDTNIVRVENVAPYALFGDNGGDFLGGIPLEAGDYTLSLAAFSQKGANGELLDTEFISFTVTDEENLPPTILPILQFLSENDVPATIDLLSDASDPEDDPISFGEITTVSASDGRDVLFDVDEDGRMLIDPGQFNDLGAMELLDINIGYTITDGISETPNVLSLKINGANDAPVAVDDDAFTLEGEVVSVNVLANDTDPEDNFISIFIIDSMPTGGSVLVHGDKILYEPAGGFLGEDSFSYRVVDQFGAISNQAFVTVEVSEDVPPPPPPTDVTIMQTVSFDGEQRDSSGFDTAQGGKDNDLEIGNGDATGLIFENVAIADGATIQSASLILTSQRSQSGAADIEISLFDSADAVQNGGTNTLGDPGFDAFVFVPFEVTDPWVDGQAIETPDLSSLVQNLIDSDPQGDGLYDLSFRLSATDGIRRIEAEEFGDGVAAELLITYTTDLMM